jgi:cellulose synthase/poly-beta-1,6-N-acetylglucosamine synthase-like glycosyltransferase
LFRETSVLPQLLLALRGLAYPRHLLDIKLILEESDTAMQRAVASHVLEEFFDVIIVPAGHPQTKPRALNYAMAFARGELVTIYDAEDLPEPQQLRKAAACFAASPPELACVQAELAFFNGADGWLARQFAIEYASLFCVILPCLAQDRLPLPLGGTSNHFRRSVLEAMGAWDPFNVTEDADLGIRMARAGYRTGVIASRTLEEANVSLLSWIKQRSRWLKGFLLTWLVHMRQPVLTMRELGFGGFWVMTAMTLGVFLSALLHPLFLLKIGFDVLTARPPDDGNILVTGFSGLALALFLCGYVCAYLIGRRGIGQRSRTWSFALLTMPIYWLLFMPAAWLALYEALFRPFHWHKTQHGVVVAKQTAKSVIAP